MRFRNSRALRTGGCSRSPRHRASPYVSLKNRTKSRNTEAGLNLSHCAKIVKHVLRKRPYAIEEFKTALQKRITRLCKLDEWMQVGVVRRGFKQMRNPVDQVVVRALL